MRSRSSFAIMLAAITAGYFASAFTSQVQGIFTFGQNVPSARPCISASDIF